jgi:hypothetical protein
MHDKMLCFLAAECQQVVFQDWPCTSPGPGQMPTRPQAIPNMAGAEQQTFVDTRAVGQRDVLAEQVPLFGRTK